MRTLITNLVDEGKAHPVDEIARTESAVLLRCPGSGACHWVPLAFLQGDRGAPLLQPGAMEILRAEGKHFAPIQYPQAVHSFFTS